MTGFTGASFSRSVRNWLIGVGVFELLLGGGFAIAGARASENGAGALITGAALGLVGIILVALGIRSGRKAARVERIEETGLSGEALITGLTQTGVFLNANPQVAMDLQVSVSGQEPYQIRHKEFVPLILLGRVAVGSPLPVKVDPNDRSGVVIEWEASTSGSTARQAWGSVPGAPATGAPSGWDVPAPAAPAAGISGQAVVDQLKAMGTTLDPSALAHATVTGTTVTGKAAADHLQRFGITIPATVQVRVSTSVVGADASTVDDDLAALESAGIPGRVTVQKATDTGLSTPRGHLFALDLRVEVTGRTPYQLHRHPSLVPEASAGRVVVGASFPAKVDATDPSRMLIGWDQA